MSVRKGARVEQERSHHTLNNTHQDPEPQCRGTVAETLFCCVREISSGSRILAGDPVARNTWRPKAGGRKANERELEGGVEGAEGVGMEGAG